ncbi:MAG: hypothetical protein OIN84_16855, partial [Candidatus Methanoperedens sp.]|nr:hypothetical protein [Candidatus Methanoperedens sp.]
WSTLTAPEAIGGDRDLRVHRVGPGLRSLTGDVGLSFPNTVSLACGLEMQGCLHLIYDGPDNSDAINHTGLNGVDLTEGGTRNAFKFATTSDLGANVEITVYQDATHFSVSKVTVAADPTFTFVDTVAGFSEFVPAGPDGGADFNHVGALAFDLCNGPPGADISMKVIMTVYDPKFGDGSPRTQGYWKNHPDAWPVEELTLGAMTYPKDLLLALLGQPTKGDASMILANQLIATRLNIAAGCDPSAIQYAAQTAESLLSGFPGSLPFAIAKKDPRRALMLAAAAQLDAYNNSGE